MSRGKAYGLYLSCVWFTFGAALRLGPCGMLLAVPAVAIGVSLAVWATPQHRGTPPSSSGPDGDAGGEVRV